MVLAALVAASVCSQAAPGALVGPAPTPLTETASLPTLQEVFSPGGPVLRDRNGDGTIDFVDASLVLPEAPTASEVAAAANIAARLGFESAEMNLPLPRGGGRLTIAVGAGAVRRMRIAAAPAGLMGLAAGEGMVRVLGSPERPVLVVAGNDGTGTFAAGEFVAARLPYAWDVKGATLGQVMKDVQVFLDAHGVPAARLALESVRVKAGGDAIERLGVSAVFESVAQRARAEAALRVLVRPVKEAKPSARPLDYPGVRTLRVALSTPGTEELAVDIPRATPPPPAPLARRAGASKDALDLSSLYSIDGMLGDSDSNLIPDRTEVLLAVDGPGIEPVVDLAARIGLESAGVSLPLVYPAASIEKPQSEPTLVLIGTANPLIERLVAEKKFDRTDLKPGEGVVSVVRKAFGDKSAVVVTGADTAGMQRAVSHFAQRMPHVWARGKDRPTLDDVEEEVRRFFGGRTPAGQAAIGIYKLDRILQDLPPASELKSVVVGMNVDRPSRGFSDYVLRHVEQRLQGVRVTAAVDGRDVRSALPSSVVAPRVGGEFAIPSEADEFWGLVRTRVIPAIRRRAVVALEARLSEPPEVRARLEREVMAELVKAGADPSSSVIVLCAYKQGYSWLYDVVRPALAEKPVDRIRVRFAEAGPPPEWKQQAMFIPTRWLHEIFPIDEVLARDLRLDLKQITFEKMPVGSTTYAVLATAKDGGTLYAGTFEPKVVVRPYFDRFPDYEKVRVTTGWMVATVAGTTAVNQRIETDTERFWDLFQSKTLPEIYDYVMQLTRGKPRPEDAPHFGELQVDLTLSEPDYALGIDQERISSLEAMHEEIYFATLHFFDLLGRMNRGQPLDYPGHIVPVMRPVATGQRGHASITFTGYSSPRPRVSLLYETQDGRNRRVELDIPKAAVERPSATSAVVRDGAAGIERLDLRLKVDTDKDQREALVTRARAERVDEQILSAEQAVGVLTALGKLRDAGLYREALAYPDLREIRVIAGWDFEPAREKQREATLPPNGVPPPLPDITTFEPQPGPRPGPDAPLVQWHSPMAPSDAYAVMARMSRFKEATVYRAGESYLGQDVWAMDLTAPITASHWSQAKATTLKPTVLLSARQHANEVSSTSHVLKLAELLLTDPAYRKTLDKVNVVIHPITNPDGARLVSDLWRITPDFMLHAGYLGSLGVDVTTAQWETDSLYPESRVRAVLWRAWLPDLFLNPHGYPSHEWVQPFSEYAGWVRNRVSEARDWWGMRGWFMPGFSYVDDPKYPRHKDAAFQIRGLITQAINSVPEIRALNERAYGRYRRYGFAFNQEDFKLDFTDGVLIYTALKGSRPNPRGTDPMLRQPNITIWSGTTEAPDEPARGDWMTLVATAGLQWDKALVDYLASGHHEIERKRDIFWGGVTLSLNRPRPPRDKPEPPDPGSR
jgi:hypothetical protein